MTVREELKEQLAAEKEERSGKSRKALSRANLPVSANATANGLSTAHTPNGGAQGVCFHATNYLAAGFFLIGTQSITICLVHRSSSSNHPPCAHLSCAYVVE